MSRPGVFGTSDDSAGRISRLAILKKDEEALEAVTGLKITPSPLLMRLAMAAVAGILFYMGNGWALWVWPGAVFFMLSLTGASGGVGLAAGALTATIGYFRVLETCEPTGIFWAIMLFCGGAGAFVGAASAEMSRKMHPAAFAFLAPLLPAGLEHLGSFAAGGNLVSLALTQYEVPVVVRMARLGGLSGVTYVILVFGAAVAVAVRFIRVPDIVLKASAPAAGFVLLAFLYGAVSSCESSERLSVASFNGRKDIEGVERLSSREPYDEGAWTKYATSMADTMHRISEKRAVARAIRRDDREGGLDIAVWPEASIVLNPSVGDVFFKRVASTAEVTECVQVVGYYEVDRMESLAIIVSGRKDIDPNYARLNYLPDADDRFFPDQIAVPGVDPPTAVSTPAGTIGALLSLDANFFENFESIARSGGGVVCVCGLDDVRTPGETLRVLVYNAALSGTAVVRNARRGKMAVVGPDGDIIARTETQEKADTELRAEVPVGSGRTLFMTIGNAFAWLAMLTGLGAAIYASSLPASGLYGETVRERERPGSGAISYKTRAGLKRL
ncbi:MAG: hypothetical protein ACYTAN_11390 [Planctomycetota bacterium]